MNNTKLSLNCLLIGSSLYFTVSHAKDDYKCEVDISPEKNVLISTEEEKSILDKNDGNLYQFKATAKFTPDSEGEWIEYLGGKTRKYKWEPESMMQGESADGGFSSIGTCTPKETDWGTEFKVKVNVKMGLIGRKKKTESADNEMDVIAPLIKIQSAKFSKNGGGNGFIIHDRFRGNAVAAPEFKKNDNTQEKDKSPIGYYSGDTPVYVVTFEALPESMKTLTVKYNGTILGSDETDLSIDGGKAEGSVTAKNALKRECKGAAENSFWSFSVLGVRLSQTETMNISKCYVLLDEGNRDKPWKSLLRVAFDKWNFNGVTSHAQLIDKLSKGISNNADYYNEWNPETGKTGSLYVDQKQSPMPLSVARMIDAFDTGSAKIICAEAAGLMEYSSFVLGSGGVNSRGINWTEFKTVINAEGKEEEKTWSSGHGYCLYGGEVHNPVPSNGGNKHMSESQYIESDLKAKPNTKDFTSPRELSFSFKE